MAGPSWLVDKSRIATKIKSASGTYDADKLVFKSNPTRTCPNCQHAIDNSDVARDWPGLPKGVKFDPSDQEIIWHLLAKVGVRDSKPHPFIDEFITTIEVDDGICYTHPKHLPGVKQDGSVSHFFHKAIKAYTTGNRKRRRIQGDSGDVRWHKTGKTKPVKLNGVDKGFKKIMVLYMGPVKADKTGKTNWVMHQYHLGTEADEKDGEYVISKVFYQQQQPKSADKDDQEDIPEATETTEAKKVKVDPVTPKSVTPDPPRNERQSLDVDAGEETHTVPQMDCLDEIQADCEQLAKADLSIVETQQDKGMEDNIENDADNQQDKGMEDHKENDADNADDGSKWWDSESQNLLDSQQLADALAICDDLLQSQSPNRDGKNGKYKEKPSLSVYADLGPEYLKKDIEECQNLALDPAANIEQDTPPEFRLSQLEFGSQDSFVAWGGSKAVN